MPSKVYWAEEPAIAAADYEGVVTTEDLEHVMAECLKMVEVNPVYFVVDMLKATSLPKNILKLASLSKLVNHPNSRWFAFIGPPVIVRFAMQVIHRKSAKIFETREDGLIFLRERVQAERVMEEQRADAN